MEIFSEGIEGTVKLNVDKWTLDRCISLHSLRKLTLREVEIPLSLCSLLATICELEICDCVLEEGGTELIGALLVQRTCKKLKIEGRRTCESMHLDRLLHCLSVLSNTQRFLKSLTLTFIPLEKRRCQLLSQVSLDTLRIISDADMVDWSAFLCQEGSRVGKLFVRIDVSDEFEWNPESFTGIYKLINEHPSLTSFAFCRSAGACIGSEVDFSKGLRPQTSKLESIQVACPDWHKVRELTDALAKHPSVYCVSFIDTLEETDDPLHVLRCVLHMLKSNRKIIWLLLDTHLHFKTKDRIDDQLFNKLVADLETQARANKQHQMKISFQRNRKVAVRLFRTMSTSETFEFLRNNGPKILENRLLIERARRGKRSLEDLSD